jgi:hypothetical protein
MRLDGDADAKEGKVERDGPVKYNDEHIGHIQDSSRGGVIQDSSGLSMTFYLPGHQGH